MMKTFHIQFYNRVFNLQNELHINFFKGIQI